MKMTRVVGTALLVAAGASALWAAGLQSGLPVGGKITPYKAVKCGGAEDGVEFGKSLCYT
jgi:hypothetical protein